MTETNNRGLWAMDDSHPLTALLREGQMVNGKKIRTLIAFTSGNGSPGQGRGWLHTTEGGSSRVLALALLSGKMQAVLSADLDGRVTTLSESGPSGVGGPGIAGANFASYGVPAANAAGYSAFRASLTVGAGGVTAANAEGIFLLTPPALLYTPVARTGDSAGTTGAKFSVLKDPVLAGDGGVAFAATIKGGGVSGIARQTLWWKPPGDKLRLLAQGGGEPPTLPGAKWESFTSLAITASRGPIFTASLVLGEGGVTANKATGVWAMASDGALQLLFRAGDKIDGKKLLSFNVLKAVPGSTGVTHSFNGNGSVIWRATFADGTQEIIETTIP